MSIAAELRFANTAAVAQLVREAERRVEGLPGVEALAATISIPLDGSPLLGFTIEGRPFNGGQQEEVAGDPLVFWGLFEVFRIPPFCWPRVVEPCARQARPLGCN